jgi:hypothetical protein
VANIDNWQPDFSNFSNAANYGYSTGDYGNAVPGLPGSWYANVRLPTVRSIMYQVGDAPLFLLPLPPLSRPHPRVQQPAEHALFHWN